MWGGASGRFREHLQLRTEVSLFLCFQELQAGSPTWILGEEGCQQSTESFGSKRQEVTFVMDVVTCVSKASTLRSLTAPLYTLCSGYAHTCLLYPPFTPAHLPPSTNSLPTYTSFILLRTTFFRFHLCVCVHGGQERPSVSWLSCHGTELWLSGLVVGIFTS